MKGGLGAYLNYFGEIAVKGGLGAYLEGEGCRAVPSPRQVPF